MQSVGQKLDTKPEPASLDPGAPEISPEGTFFPKRQKLERRVTLVITILPFLALAVAVFRLWGKGISIVDGGMLVGFYFLTMLGLTVGFHRLFTHRSFDAVKPLRVILAIAGSMAIEGSLVSWVADHRRHHAFTDKPGDPHSPHLDEAQGFKGVIKGLWHAHIGWFFNKERTWIPKFAPDLIKDRSLRIVSDLFPVWVVISLGVPFLLGWAITRTLAGALTALLWGGLVRVFLAHHVTWSINSICHFYGKRKYESDDLSTNNWALSLVAFGEGWHNNHHAFPTSAVHGIDKGQLDLSGAVIRLFARVGLVSNVRTPSEIQLASKRLAAEGTP
ncbi:MAG: acyl-CoA desaturase [Actinobacteria bacterium]|nr:acyl-CoA desaturase [Actinomycetota bacterium]